MREKLGVRTRGAWATLVLAARKFNQIDGGQRAAAFSYGAFFALFPAIILFVTVASFFIEKGAAASLVIGYAEGFIPTGPDMRAYVFDAVVRVIQARGQAGAVALIMLVWISAQFFTTLIQAANRAWDTRGGRWWKMPLKSLALLAVVTLSVVAGLGIPTLAKLAAGALHSEYILPAAHKLSLYFVPWVAMFLSLTFFYKLAPHRRTKYAEVWLPALYASLLLYLAQSLFVLYLTHFAALNAVYGAFGGLMALLLWLYLSGVIFIFCACLCAAQAAVKAQAHG
jgi:Ca2+-transporting ATPase